MLPHYFLGDGYDRASITIIKWILRRSVRFGLPGSSRSDLINGVIFFAYLTAIGFIFFNPVGWLFNASLFVIVIGAALGWLSAYRRFHLIADTPTSRIASAAQGYVELVGHCELFPGELPLGFRSGPPCVWYRFTVSRSVNGQIEVIDRGQSDDTFMIKDASGHCVIDPDDAEIHTTTHKNWTEGDYMISLSYFAPNEKIYALGELKTIGGSHLSLDKRTDISVLLADWKRKPEMMLDRFDANKDGKIDLQEWEQARKAANKEVDEQHCEIRLNKDIHIVCAPTDERPFVLSNQDPDRLVRRFQWWSWFHLMMLIGSVVTLLVLLGRDVI